MDTKFAVIVFINLSILLAESKINVKDLRCLVCETLLDEFNVALNKLDPNIKVDVGGYRIDSDGNLHKKRVDQTKSETQLSELADAVCDRMDDYVRATYKDSGELMLLRMIGPDGMMNPQMSEVNIIQDDDLNKSLKYYCEGIFEEHEDSIIKHYADESDNIAIRICSLEAKLCKKTLPKQALRVDL